MRKYESMVKSVTEETANDASYHQDTVKIRKAAVGKMSEIQSKNTTKGIKNENHQHGLEGSQSQKFHPTDNKSGIQEDLPKFHPRLYVKRPLC